MFQLSKLNIHLGQQANNKEEVIEKITDALVQSGSVVKSYIDDMLVRERQASTFLGNGIAIPHGMIGSQNKILRTDIQIFQFPNGVVWEKKQIVYVAIGIAANNSEYIKFLYQLSHILSDDCLEQKLKFATTSEELQNLLIGEKQTKKLKFDKEMLTLNIETSDIRTLQKINVERLKKIGAVENEFVTHIFKNKPLNLGQGIWIDDSPEGNLYNAITISCPKNSFDIQEETVSMLITISMIDDQPICVLQHLNNLLLNGRANDLLESGEDSLLALLSDDYNIVNKNTFSAEYIVRNEHGLHARPGAILVNTIKNFESKITVTNLDGNGMSVNARSLMKVMTLGVKKGHRLKFTAHGVDAEHALKSIGNAIEAGLGEKI